MSELKVKIQIDNILDVETGGLPTVNGRKFPSLGLKRKGITQKKSDSRYSVRKKWISSYSTIKSVMK
ncbi:hypothetical protein PANI_CDS0039 [Maribacter phage Panino]